MVQHFLMDLDLGEKKYWEVLKLAQSVKKNPAKYSKALAGKNVAMLFAKNSTRTRVSFEVGINQLGANAIFLSSSETQLGRGEPIKDTARVLERYVDGIVARLFAQQDLADLAEYCHIPVINALTDFYHPCQALGDLLTILEQKKSFRKVKLCFLGNGSDNVAHSLILSSALTGLNLSVACPKNAMPDDRVLAWANALGFVTVDGTPWKNPLVGRESIQITRKPKDRPNIDITADPIRGVKNADYLYTDVWVSMGEDEGKLNDRLNALKPFQLNGELYRQAKPGAKVMHCLPAHRGEEITDEVMEWNETSSAIWRQAENRLHAQKALLITLLK